MRILLFLLLGSLLPLTALAQTTISGRVLDGSSGNGLPGVTILQSGTTNGVSSNADGSFTLTVPELAAAVALSFSSIGYTSQRLSVVPGSPVTVQLRVEYKTFNCSSPAYPRAEIGLNSGVRYAPFGASLKLYGGRRIFLPFTTTLVSLPNLVAEVNYQTNFNQNRAFTARLGLPTWQRRYTMAASLHYQLLQAEPATIRFQSYSTVVSIGTFHPISPSLWTMVLVGGGHARCSPLLANDRAETAGFGYSLGLENGYTSRFYGLTSSVLATRWQSYWQWQAHLLHPFGRFQAGVAYNHLRQYSEFSVLLKRTLY